MRERPFGMDAPSTADDALHRRGLLQLGLASSAFVASMGASYLLPGAERYQPWQPGEGLPIARLFQEHAEAAPESIASPTEARGPVLTEVDVVVPPPVAPGQPVRIEESELAGLVRPIEDSSGHAMDAFYAQLERTARREDDAITRIAYFGDSTIALDGITMTVRELMQLRFGDAGHGFVLAAKGFLPYRHFQVRHDSEGPWRVFDLTHLGLSDGLYGLGGVQSRSVSGGRAMFETDDADDARVGREVSSFTILHQRFARGGEFEVRVDGGEWQRIDTASEATVDGLHRVEVPTGPHRLDLRTMGHGETRLYGVVLEREGPGVVLDSLGIVGARMQRMQGFAPAHLSTQLAQRESNLVVIAFGGNDADDDRTEEDFFTIARDVARLVRRARPEASCLLVAPLDQAERNERGRIETLPSLPRIVSAQRRAAEAEGCAFFDTWTAMGGEGSMGRWFRRTPRLATGDFRHATPAGYRVVGGMLYRALLAGLRTRLTPSPEASPSQQVLVAPAESVDAGP